MKVSPGQVFGRLTVIALNNDKGRRRWVCQCSCGAQHQVLAQHLVNGHAKSCGCFRRELYASAITRKSGAPRAEYRAWYSMKDRCHNPRNPSYKFYGGRGIHVCERWRSSFAAFISDMGPKPSRDHSIDRIDNDKGYEPGNCRWATKMEQSSNRRDTVRIKHNGEEFCREHWARQLGIRGSSLYYRAERLGDYSKAIVFYQEKMSSEEAA